MHMADALLSPAVGGTMWAASAGAIAYSSRLGRNLDDRKIPLMGVMGAFLFAAQMINFSIPGTGSSGHLGGGLLLSVLLGPAPALLTIASVLVVQALFFADGGLLALGCNIFNLGIIPAFIVYPLIYRNLIGRNPCQFRRVGVTMLSAVVGLQLGALAVVLETVCSGVSSLPFANFLMLMQPIHLAIAMVEGAITVAVLNFLGKVPHPHPVLPLEGEGTFGGRLSLEEEGTFSGRLPLTITGGGGKVLVGLLLCAILTAGVLSWFACKNPDGLEWAVAKVAGEAGLTAPKTGWSGALSRVQESTAWFPDYSFKTTAMPGTARVGDGNEAGVSGNAATSIAGIIGTLMTLVLILLSGLLLKKFKQVRR